MPSRMLNVFRVSTAFMCMIALFAWVAPSEAAPSGNRTRAGFGDATVNQYGSGDSWVGTYELTLPDGSVVTGAGCVDHGVNYPSEQVSLIDDPQNISTEAKGALSYLMWQYGSASDDVTAAAVSLVVHDLTDQADGGTSTWGLDVSTMDMGGGFGGQGQAVKDRAIALKSEAFQRRGAWTLDVTDAERSGDAITVTGSLKAVDGTGVPGFALEVFGGTAPIGGFTDIDGNFSVVVNQPETSGVVLTVNSHGPAPYLTYHGSNATQRVVAGADQFLQDQIVVAEVLASAAITKATDNPAWQSGEGAIFEIRFDTDDNGSFETVVETLVINSEQALSRPLPVGDYQVVETQAPEGQALLAPFEITLAVGETYEIDAVNEVIRTGSLRIHKTSDGEHLQGAVFRVDFDSNGDGSYDTVIAQNLTTDAAGVVEVSDLTQGRYQITETSAPDGFVLDPTPVVVDVTWDGANTPALVEMVNNELVGHRFAKTVAGNNPSHFTLAGAVFEVRTQGGDLVPEATCTIGETGDCLIPSVLEASVTYCWVETAAPIGTQLAVGDCFVAAAGGVDGPQTTIVQNDATMFTAKVIKTDGMDVTIPVPGALFDLCQQGPVAGWTMPTAPPSADAVIQTPSDGVLVDCFWVDEATTDANGEVDFAAHPAGDGITYCLTERVAPIGWVLDRTPNCFVPVPAGIADPVVFELPVPESRETFEVQLSKLSSGFGPARPVDGAVYALFASPTVPDVYTAAVAAELGPVNASVAVPAEYANMIQVGTMSTDSAGVASATGLITGEWCLTEAVAPPGFDLNPAFLCVNSTDVLAGVAAVQTADQVAHLTVDICKHDQDVTEGICGDTTGRLDGAKYHIWIDPAPVAGQSQQTLPAEAFGTAPPVPAYGTDGIKSGSAELIEAQKPGNAAYLFFKEVTAGTDSGHEAVLPLGYSYCIIEVQAPDGYMLNRAEMCETPVAGELAHQVRQGNQKAPKAKQTTTSNSTTTTTSSTSSSDPTSTTSGVQVAGVTTIGGSVAGPTLPVTGGNSRVLIYLTCGLFIAGWLVLEVEHQVRRRAAFV